MRVRGKAASDSGAAAVEFGIVLLLLVMLLFGIIQYGYTFFEYIQVAQSAREGVRWGALGATDTEISARARAAAPALSASLNITIARGSETVSVTAEYPVTKLAPLPSIAVPDSVSSTAVQKKE